MTMASADEMNNAAKWRSEYEKQLQNSGILQTPKQFATCVGGVVRNKLFPKVKFVRMDQHLEFGGKYCRFIFDQLAGTENMSVKQKRIIWKGMRAMVHKGLKGKRNNTMSTFAKPAIVSFREQTIPAKENLEDYERFAATKDDVTNLALFCEKFLSLVVGRNNFNLNCWQVPLSEWATKTDEAFAVLVLYNQYDTLEAKAGDHKFKPDWGTLPAGNNEEGGGGGSENNDDDAASAKYPKPLYTRNGASARRDGGWTNKGVEKFNQLVQDVKKLRSGPKCKEIEAALMEHFKEQLGRGKRNTENSGFVGQDTVDAADDFSDEDEDGEEENKNRPPANSEDEEEEEEDNIPPQDDSEGDEFRSSHTNRRKQKKRKVSDEGSASIQRGRHRRDSSTSTSSSRRNKGRKE